MSVSKSRSSETSFAWAATNEVSAETTIVVDNGFLAVCESWGSSLVWVEGEKMTEQVQQHDQRQAATSAPVQTRDPFAVQLMRDVAQLSSVQQQRAKLAPTRPMATGQVQMDGDAEYSRKLAAYTKSIENSCNNINYYYYTVYQYLKKQSPSGLGEQLQIAQSAAAFYKAATFHRNKRANAETIAKGFYDDDEWDSDIDTYCAALCRLERSAKKLARRPADSRIATAWARETAASYKTIGTVAGAIITRLPVFKAYAGYVTRLFTMPAAVFKVYEKIVKSYLSKIDHRSRGDRCDRQGNNCTRGDD